jgi:hypothetical protein
MTGVVMAALAMSVLNLLAGSRLTKEHRAWFGSGAVLALLTIPIHWSLSSISVDRLPFWSRITVSVFVLVSGTATFASLLITLAVSPEGSAIVVAMMVTLIIYLSTWA